MQSVESTRSQLSHLARYGEGATSVVYTAEYNGQLVILKVRELIHVSGPSHKDHRSQEVSVVVDRF